MPQMNLQNVGPAQLGIGSSSDSYWTQQEIVPDSRNPNMAQEARPEPTTEFQQFIADSLGRMLPIYGQKLFEKAPSTFAPSNTVPVPPNYKIGPGDELVIRAWGLVNLEQRTTVGRDGQIYVPKVGSINMAGVEFADAPTYLKREIGRVYKNFDLSVSMGRLKSIDVYLVGKARYPGKYTMSSLSTLVNALFTSGGPSTSGSMRHITLSRGGKVLVDFDLYDVLVRGDVSKDIPLMSGDIITFASVGPMAAIAGSVNSPAIYELKSETNLRDLISVAGGLSEVADGGRVTVERIADHSIRQVEEFSIYEQAAQQIKGGDLVRVLSIIPKFENAVTLRGNVANPGRYRWHDGMRVSDLVPSREALLTREYWLKQSQSVLGCSTDYPVITKKLNKQGVPAQDQANGQLQQMPPESDDLEVNKPPSLCLSPLASGNPRQGNQNAEGRSWTDVKNVRPVVPEVNWNYAVIQRINPVDLSTELVPFNLGAAIMDHREADNILLKPGDTVTVFSQRDLSVPIETQTKFVEIGGEVLHPGTYRVGSTETLRDIFVRAGGVTNRAYLYGTRLLRESARRQQQQVLSETVQMIELGMQQKPSADPQTLAAQTEIQRQTAARLRQIKVEGRVVLQVKPGETEISALPPLILEDGDRITVPYKAATISVVGAVFSQSGFLYEPKRKVKDYMRLAGNGTVSADRKHVMVVRADGSVLGNGSASSMWRGSIADITVLPGDTVVIPSKMDSGAWIRGLKDWTQLASQFAITAASLAVVTQ